MFYRLCAHVSSARHVSWSLGLLRLGRQVHCYLLSDETVCP
jgi:hypothetical protein